MIDTVHNLGADRTDTIRAGRPKDPSKRAALVRAAQDLFLERGFEATSVDGVAQTAGVAKVTVYSHFPNKQALFAEAIRDKCDTMLDITEFGPGAGANVHERLEHLARQFYALVSDPDAMAMHKLVASEGARVPEVAEVFFENAIQSTCKKVASVLAQEVAQGTLVIDDLNGAAGQFLALVKGMPMLRSELNMPPLNDDQFTEHVKSAVTMFIRAYRGHRG
jgi:TetR/AcrR family transcriptional regulator, mexJK operon transcriptional repressor